MCVSCHCDNSNVMSTFLALFESHMQSLIGLKRLRLLSASGVYGNSAVNRLQYIRWIRVFRPAEFLRFPLFLRKTQYVSILVRFAEMLRGWFNPAHLGTPWRTIAGWPAWLIQPACSVFSSNSTLIHFSAFRPSLFLNCDP